MASVSQSQLNCDICLDVPTEAVDSDCCHHLFCSACVQNLTSCPICRNATFRYTANHVLRRIIGDLPVSCDFTGCTATVTRSNADSHRKNCPFGKLTCPINGCEAKMLPAELIPHLVAQHKLAEGRSIPTSIREPPETTVYHTGVTCSSCGQNPIKNRRYTCLMCPYYHLCDNCEAQHIHKEHLMIRIYDPVDVSLEALVAPTSTATSDSSVESRSNVGFEPVPLLSSLQPLPPVPQYLDQIPPMEQDETFAAILAALTSMGFSNEDGSLYRLIEAKEGNINDVLSTLANSPTGSTPLLTDATESTSQQNDSLDRLCDLCGVRYQGWKYLHLDECPVRLILLMDS